MATGWFILKHSMFRLLPKLCCYNKFCSFCCCAARAPCDIDRSLATGLSTTSTVLFIFYHILHIIISPSTPSFKLSWEHRLHFTIMCMCEP